MGQTIAQQKAKEAAKSSARLNPAAQEFHPSHILNPIFSHSLLYAALFERPEISVVPRVAGDIVETNHATGKDIEAEKSHEERGTPPTRDVNEHLHNLWAMPAQLEETVETMKIAYNDMLAWKSVITREFASEGGRTDWEEVMKKFKKAVEKQDVVVGVFRTQLHRAKDQLAGGSVKHEE